MAYSDQKEEGRGYEGEGFAGTIIKDTWIITRGVELGQVGGEGWDSGEGLGGNTYNCNVTTIKNVKK